MQKLISVHVAKSGGTSLGELLKGAYGQYFLDDYSADPADPLSQRNLDPEAYFRRDESLPHNIYCVHGHFNPGKYKISKDIVLFTILRHPVDNIISIYTFWKTIAATNGLHAYSQNNDLDILGVARLPLLRYLYSRTYFGDFDMSRFDLIGRHEKRLDAISKLSSLIGVEFTDDKHDNTTAHSFERERITKDLSIRSDLKEILKDDIAFYERFVA